MLLHPERDHLADKNGRCLRLQHVRAGIIVAFLIVVAASLVAAGTAYACSTTTIQNGNYSVPAHTWLKLTVNRRYDDNNVWKSGWADCQKMIAPNSSPELKYTYTCSSSGFAYGFSDDLGRAPYPNCNTYMAALMLNNTGSSGVFNFYQHY